MLSTAEEEEPADRCATTSPPTEDSLTLIGEDNTVFGDTDVQVCVWGGRGERTSFLRNGFKKNLEVIGYLI